MITGATDVTHDAICVLRLGARVCCGDMPKIIQFDFICAPDGRGDTVEGVREEIVSALNVTPQNADVLAAQLSELLDTVEQMRRQGRGGREAGKEAHEHKAVTSTVVASPRTPVKKG